MTKWVDSHPGGHLSLLNVAGRDGTDNFLAYHPASVWAEKLPYFLIGRLSADEAKPSAFVQEFRDLRMRFLRESEWHRGAGSVPRGVALCAWRQCGSWVAAVMSVCPPLCWPAGATSSLRLFLPLLPCCVWQVFTEFRCLVRDPWVGAGARCGCAWLWFSPIAAWVCLLSPSFSTAHPIPADLYDTDMTYYIKHLLFILSLLATGLYLTLGCEVRLGLQTRRCCGCRVHAELPVHTPPH